VFVYCSSLVASVLCVEETVAAVANDSVGVQSFLAEARTAERSAYAFNNVSNKSLTTEGHKRTVTQSYIEPILPRSARFPTRPDCVYTDFGAI